MHRYTYQVVAHLPGCGTPTRLWHTASLGGGVGWGEVTQTLQQTLMGRKEARSTRARGPPGEGDA